MLADFISFMCFSLVDLNAQPISYETLQLASEIALYPTRANLMRQFAMTSQQQMLRSEMAEGAHPQMHGRVMELIKNFLAYKRSLGS